MSVCGVKNCSNSFRKTRMKSPTIKYFTFPKDSKFIEAWRKVCRDEINVTYGKMTLIYINILGN